MRAPRRRGRWATASRCTSSSGASCAPTCTPARPSSSATCAGALVDALYARGAVDGLLRLTLDLEHLVQDPAIRWGFAWDPSGQLRIDAPRLGDADAIAARSGRAARVWLADARRWFDEAPDRVTVVRDEDDVIAGYGIAATPANAPAFAAEDPVIGPRLRHAARKVPGGAAVVFRQAVDLTHGSGASVTSLLGLAGILGSGLANPASAYLPIVRGDLAAEAFSAACGARPIDELVVERAGVRVECHHLDYGPGGLLAFQHAAVYRELGLPPPAALPTLEEVRQALRQLGLAGAAGARPARADHGDARRARRGGPGAHRAGRRGGVRRVRRGSRAARGARARLPGAGGQPRAGRGRRCTSAAPPTSAGCGRRSRASPRTSRPSAGSPAADGGGASGRLSTPRAGSPPTGRESCAASFPVVRSGSARHVEELGVRRLVGVRAEGARRAVGRGTLQRQAAPARARGSTTKVSVNPWRWRSGS